MTISRRKFAQAAGVAFAATSLSGPLSSAFAQRIGSKDLFHISAATYGERLLGLNSAAFQPFIGTIFRTRIDDVEGTSLRLTEVKQSPQLKGSLGNGESFSLIFRGVSRKRDLEGVHTFEHPTLGTFSLFISPVERARMNFEAVVNHVMVH